MRRKLRRWLGAVRGDRGPACPVALPVPAEPIDASLHVDTEAICPDCLQWIGPADFVRRNAIGILEHEVCPPVSVQNYHR